MSRLVITLTKEQTEKYLEIAKAKTESEFNSNCEPSGSVISIEIAGNNLYDNVVLVNGEELNPSLGIVDFKIIS